MLTDTQWAVLEPLVEQCRPKGKTPQDLLALPGMKIKTNFTAMATTLQAYGGARLASCDTTHNADHAPAVALLLVHSNYLRYPQRS